MDEAKTALILLASALFFALLIERALELIMGIVAYVEARIDASRFWNTHAHVIAGQLQQRLDLAHGHSDLERTIIDMVTGILNENDYSGRIVVVSTAKVRKLVIKTATKLIGICMGVSLALGLQINAFTLLETLATGSPGAGDLFQANLSHTLGCMLTGVAMGLGSAPVHKFIVRLESARKFRQAIQIGVTR